MSRVYSPYLDDFGDAVRDLALKKYGYVYGVFDQVTKTFH